MSQTVAQGIISLLQSNGINNIFGVIGDAAFPFFDELGKQDKIKYYGASHEVGAAFMASYQAKLTGKASVCVATSGPGTANLINGLAEAYFDQAPLLAITGQVSTKKIGTNAKQYLNQQQLLQSVTMSSELVTSAESALPVLAKALAQAVNNKTVTHVSIPEDLFSQALPNSVKPQITVNTGNSWGTGFADQLEKIIPMLNSSQKNLIIVGQAKQVWRKNLIKLADKLNAGIILAQQAKGVIPDNHPTVIGGIGQANAPTIIGQADNILLVGTASFEKKFIPSNTQLIQLAEKSTAVDYGRASQYIIGDLAQLIKLLAERVNKKQNTDWLEAITAEKQGLVNMIAQQEQTNTTPIQPAYLMITLSKTVPANATIVCDIGGFIHWFDTYFQAQDQNILVSSHWRSMGGGLPGALSACIARPDRAAVALVGDGGLLMSLGELATAVKYKLPVIVVVANNHQYNLEKSMMETTGMTPFGYDIKVPDFSKLAQAFGAKGKSVTQAEQLEEALIESFTDNETTVIDVHLSDISLPILK